MGLDMYLYAKKYFWGSEWTEKAKIEMDMFFKAHGTDVVGDVKYIMCEAVYWRKANAIHKWFVENVQQGEDDCEEYDVSIDQLRELLRVCKKALEERNLSERPLGLETTEGFFFGGTGYDDWFWEGVQYTVDKLTVLLKRKDLDKWDFVYRSSW